MRSHAHLLALAAVLAGAPSFVSAQSGCFEPVGNQIGTGDDVVLGIQPLGFAFPFNGTTYTHAHICTNGFLYLSNNGTPAPGGANCCSGTTALLVAGSPMICPRFDDLNMISGTGAVYLNALPGRAVITWQNAVEYGNTVQFTLQCTLSVTGSILFSYDTVALQRTVGNALVGFSPGNAAPVPAASDLSVVGNSAVNTVFELFDMSGTPAMWDLIGMSVLFTPTGATSYVWTQQRCGVHTPYGAGCYVTSATFYELFAAATFDMSGQTVTLLPAGGGYFVTSAPVSGYFTPVAAGLGLTDDSLSPSIVLPAVFPYPGNSTSSIVVHSNGQVFLGTGAVADYTPTIANWLSRGPNVGIWNDFNPGATGSGNVHVDHDAVNFITYVTWNGTYNFGTTVPQNVQIALFLAGSSSPGKVELRFQNFNNTSTLSMVALCGFTPGNGAADPGTRDISATVPFLTPAERKALSLTAAPAPTLGAPMTWTVGNIPPTAAISALLLSFSAVVPGIDLGFLGAPGCFQHIALGGASTILIAGTPNANHTITLPTGPSWIGFSVFAQGASLVTGVNPVGVLSSNGLQSQFF